MNFVCLFGFLEACEVNKDRKQRMVKNKDDATNETQKMATLFLSFFICLLYARTLGIRRIDSICTLEQHHDVAYLRNRSWWALKDSLHQMSATPGGMSDFQPLTASTDGIIQYLLDESERSADDILTRRMAKISMILSDYQ